MQEQNDQGGLTLLELLVAIAIFSIIVGGLYQVLDHTLATYATTTSRQNLLSQASYAMERMVMFVQVSDEIVNPANAAMQELTVSERVLDTYANLSGAYLIDGDGILDADNDADGLVNEGQEDIAEYISFRLDKGIADNWKLVERRPDYRTTDTADQTQWHVVCEHVTDFACRRLGADMVEINLTLKNDNAQVNLKTRAKARNVE
ncbi:MAG: prepilin-type N-terminal cleavage/methylation domain-containing protein [Desulfobacterales bacterium]